MPHDPILIVDDNESNRKLFRILLAGAGYDVRCARDASEALAAVETILPRLILLDIHLPGMDGLTLARRLKADPRTAPIVLLAVTAYAMSGAEEEVLAAGCEGYLSKPVDVEVLLDTVAKHLGAPSDRKTP